VPARPARPGDGARPGQSGLRDRFVTLAAGLLAALPVIVSSARSVSDGWLPAGDQANIAIRAHDVLSSHTSLLGLHSDVSAVTHQAVYNLGPMLFWLLAPAARLGPPAWLAITIGAANTAAIVGCVALARRRGGALLMLATAAAIAVMCRSLAPEVLHDIWNPSAAVLPFTLLIFLCWSLACGEHRLLPLTVLVASFVAQCQLTFALPALLLLCVGLGGLGVSLWRSRRRAPDRDAAAEADRAGAPEAALDPGPARGGRARWWLLASVLVVAACWTAPLIDEIGEPRGNLTRIVETATAGEPTLGQSAGKHAVTRAVGVLPWWLRVPVTPWDRKYEVQSATSVLARISCALALCALAALVLAGLWRQRAELVAGGLIGLVLCAGLYLDAAATPTLRVLRETLGYTMWWGSPAGMFVWLIVLWPPAAALAYVARRVPGRLRPRPRALSLAATLALAAGLGGVAAVGVLVAVALPADYHRPEYRPLGAMYAALDRSVPPGRTVLLTGGLDGTTVRFKMAARFAMVRRGIRAVSPGTDTRLGAFYELRRLRYDCSVALRNGSRPPGGAGPRQAAVATLRYSQARAGRPITVWLSPPGCPRAAPASRHAAPASRRSAPGSGHPPRAHGAAASGRTARIL
jgi:hypothetical protein